MGPNAFPQKRGDFIASNEAHVRQKAMPYSAHSTERGASEKANYLENTINLAKIAGVSQSFAHGTAAPKPGKGRL
jgi:hypothetical protein